jgi:hypothetical protein
MRKRLAARAFALLVGNAQRREFARYRSIARRSGVRGVEGILDRLSRARRAPIFAPQEGRYD